MHSFRYLTATYIAALFICPPYFERQKAETRREGTSAIQFGRLFASSMLTGISGFNNRMLFRRGMAVKGMKLSTKPAYGIWVSVVITCRGCAFHPEAFLDAGPGRQGA
jgi:hypothetical protein